MQEKDLQRMVRDPKFMYFRWKGRIEKGMKTLEKEKDPEERKRMEYMLSRQVAKMKEYKKEWDEAKEDKLKKR